ncbi:hypothetical protein ONZ45_g15700 [Pleurotus djamor]|nr:hypothetical protein ONZ45_g15700 [Pleurotus djamor]
MVFFALLMAWAYTWKEYTRKPGQEPTRVWRALWDSVNFSDFAAEIAGSFRFFFAYIRGKPHTRGVSSTSSTSYNNTSNDVYGGRGGRKHMDFGEAFGLSDDGGAGGVYAPHPGMSASASQGITPSSSTYAFTSPNAVSSSSSPSYPPSYPPHSTSRSTSGPGRGYSHTHAHVPTDSEGDADGDGENIHLAPYRSTHNGRSRSGSRDFDSPSSRQSEEAYAYGGVYDAHDGYGGGGGGGGYGGGGGRGGGGFR